MSGHSKWSTIKHQKAIDDSKRSAVFTKIANKIRIAVSKGGSGDMVANPFLRTCIEEARSVNMPMENIKRAIEKALGNGEGERAEEITYEAYGPGGIGILITVVTDNRNRTGGEIKNILEKNGAKLGGPGSVSYMKLLNPVPMMEIEKLEGDAIVKLLEILDDVEGVVEVWSNLKK